jgi:hypothetical protein
MEELMIESVIIFFIYLAIGFLSYKAYIDLKTSKHIKAQAKITKPLYDFKGQLLRQYFH